MLMPYVEQNGRQPVNLRTFCSASFNSAFSSRCSCSALSRSASASDNS